MITNLNLTMLTMWMILMRILLICAHMIYFMLTNISGEPNDYILEIKEADVKNGEDASHDNVDDFNEDTCEVCLYDVKNVVHSTENNVEVQELFEDDRN